jgi:hypothetical protein
VELLTVIARSRKLSKLLIDLMEAKLKGVGRRFDKDFSARVNDYPSPVKFKKGGAVKSTCAK